MIEPVLFDFESRSRCRLGPVPARKGQPGRVGLGGRHYWAHASTEALCAAWYDTANGTIGVWYPGQEWPHHDRVLAAHNWFGFDRHGAARYGWRVAGAIDTSQQARKAGLPGALDALGTRWLGLPKDKSASAFTKGLSAVRCPRRPKDVPAVDWRAWWASLDDDDRRQYGAQPDLDEAGYARVSRYCLSDVRILAEAWPRLREWLPVDADVEAVDQVVNDRGIVFDRDLAERVIAIEYTLGERVCATVAAQLGWTAAEVRARASSQQQFCEATGAPNAQALTVADMDHPLAAARQAIASIASGKLRAGLDLVHDDGRLRDTLYYYGGHTGRWSGRGLQPQNLPRPAKWLEGADPDRVVDELIAGRVALDGTPSEISDLIAFLVRPTLMAGPGRTLVAADFKQVEGRANAWLAGDDAAVRVYTSGADPYMVAAAAIEAVCPIPAGVKARQLGKCAELACGYQGGPGAFASIAKANRTDLSALSTANRQSIVDAWRDLHGPIVRFWYATEAAFRRAVNGQVGRVSAFEYVPSSDGRSVACFLPSGRPIVYNDVRLSPSDRHKPSITYLPAGGDDAQKAAPYCPECMHRLAKDKLCPACGGPVSSGGKCKAHGGVVPMRRCPTHGLVLAEMRVATYGGSLVENSIQAYCRELMALALVRAEAAGLAPVLTAHDEIVCEVDEAAGREGLAELQSVMTTLPAWAAGFPIGADGWYGRRYRK